MSATAANILNEIVAHKRIEVESRKQLLPLAELIPQVSSCPSAQLEAAFKRTDLNTRLMLEIKPTSPSQGVMQAQLDLNPIVQAYDQMGVAISVLTDQKYFGGSLDLLSKVHQQTDRPILCKDFMIDPYQIYEARLAGAAAILLIVKILTDAQLLELYQLALSLGLTPLIEIQNKAELERALKINPSIFLINNRNLETFEIDFNTTIRLSAQIPDHILKVSASGIENRAQIEELEPYCDGFLIGSTLMKQAPETLLTTLQELTT